MNDEKMLETCLTLYTQQMEHYHKTQIVEWRGTFGAWTLSAAAISMTFEPSVRAAAAGWVWAVFMIPVLHLIWLVKIHGSEEYDKALWVKYRNEARELAGLSGEAKYFARRWWSRSGLLWLLPEVGITFGFAIVFVVRM